MLIELNIYQRSNASCILLHIHCRKRYCVRITARLIGFQTVHTIENPRLTDFFQIWSNFLSMPGHIIVLQLQSY